MRKFWGWTLFLLAWIDAGIIWYNLFVAPWKDEPVATWVPIPYIAFLILCLFGWYKLVGHRPKMEVKNDDD